MELIIDCTHVRKPPQKSQKYGFWKASELVNTSTHPNPRGQKFLYLGPSQTSPYAPFNLAVHVYPLKYLL